MQKLSSLAENIYKIYAESFRDEAHLQEIVSGLRRSSSTLLRVTRDVVSG